MSIRLAGMRSRSGIQAVRWRRSPRGRVENQAERPPIKLLGLGSGSLLLVAQEGREVIHGQQRRDTTSTRGGPHRKVDRDDLRVSRQTLVSHEAMVGLVGSCRSLPSLASP
jgi:hypothetical protein